MRDGPTPTVPYPHPRPLASFDQTPPDAGLPGRSVPPLPLPGLATPHHSSPDLTASPPAQLLPAGNQIGAAGAASLGEALATNGTLVTLDLARACL
jgi:hypothetical protein